MFHQLYSNAINTCTALMDNFKGLTFEVDRYSDKYECCNYARIILHFKDHEGIVQLHINDDDYEVWCDVINPWDKHGDYNDVHKSSDDLLEYLFHLLSLLKEA